MMGAWQCARVSYYLRENYFGAISCENWGRGMASRMTGSAEFTESSKKKRSVCQLR